MLRFLMKRIKVSDKIALINDDDFTHISKYTWREKHGYAVTDIWNKRQKKKIMVSMHRLITAASNGVLVDHVNRNRLDNQRENLRICDHQKNQANKAPRGKTKIKGVEFRNDRKASWRARLKYNNENIELGYYDNRYEAAKAYNEKSKELFGAFAYQNKLDVLKKFIFVDRKKFEQGKICD